MLKKNFLVAIARTLYVQVTRYWIPKELRGSSEISTKVTLIYFRQKFWKKKIGGNRAHTLCTSDQILDTEGAPKEPRRSSERGPMELRILNESDSLHPKPFQLENLNRTSGTVHSSCRIKSTPPDWATRSAPKLPASPVTSNCTLEVIHVNCKTHPATLQSKHRGTRLFSPTEIVSYLLRASPP